ncbi:pdz and lim domain protein zasp [Holotrichia oblita]|uniref:Pdz and lim domain protein zasp n=1 Tax=Holotrichia oblita TaxID=644536 RepID=A0ACB9TDR7_HOLOL|nr:pdz and lim domain protein zasp [Holotrichia oblita]
MAIELHLQKTTKAPWGFTLAGGVEYEVPLTVIKVAENSIAENAGMQAGDVVVRINDIPMSGLTHPEAHDILLGASNDFIMAVRRGDLTHLPPKLLLYETSVENAEDVANSCPDEGLASKNIDNDLNITDEEIVNIIGEQLQFSAQKSAVKNSMEVKHVEESRTQVKEIETHTVETKEVSTIQKHSELSKLILSDELDQKAEKKWSTFLQKPRNPKPKPKIAKVEQKLSVCNLSGVNTNNYKIVEAMKIKILVSIRRKGMKTSCSNIATEAVNMLKNQLKR